MDPTEKLRQAKDEYDKYIDALLTSLDCTEQEFGQRAVLGRRATSAWAEALRDASLQMDYTLQLDKQAEEAPARFEHFLFFLFDFRWRHSGDNDGDIAGVPASPRIPPQSGSAAKPLL